MATEHYDTDSQNPRQRPFPEPVTSMAQQESMRKTILCFRGCRRSGNRTRPDRPANERCGEHTRQTPAKSRPEALPPPGTAGRKNRPRERNGRLLAFSSVALGNILPFPFLTLRTRQAYTLFVTAVPTEIHAIPTK